MKDDEVDDNDEGSYKGTSTVEVYDPLTGAFKLYVFGGYSKDDGHGRIAGSNELRSRCNCHLFS